MAGLDKKRPLSLNQNKPMEGLSAKQRQSGGQDQKSEWGAGREEEEPVPCGWGTLGPASNRRDKTVVSPVKDFCCNLLIRVWGDR